MKRRILLVCVMGAFLSGCQVLPLMEGLEEGNQELSCLSNMPDFTQDECLLDRWVAYGLASQQGDEQWRSRLLAQLDEASALRSDQRLVKAVVLAWGSAAQRSQAFSLFQADIDTAPKNLQPLFDYWVGELEQRRKANAQLAEARRTRRVTTQQNRALQEQVDELKSNVETLTTKIEALTEIERNINARQHRE
ncbi:hypothetical protein [Halomonas halocynthiae]|uniref:hypothetical protein n=1 Tax=Halomonas halocynthiae TaxID=176290 RepID=UPI0003FAD8F0|nr:hypothetical protein [Halomonas halocynthiae]